MKKYSTVRVVRRTAPDEAPPYQVVEHQILSPHKKLRGPPYSFDFPPPITRALPPIPEGRSQATPVCSTCRLALAAFGRITRKDTGVGPKSCLIYRLEQTHQPQRAH
jgi:hypothetical protein